MLSRRVLLHEVLCNVLGCPTTGTDCHCYFQPPESLKMKYPAIVYSLDDIDNEFANDGVYLSARKYSVTVIDQDPDSEITDAVAELPYSNFNRHYTQDNLNHDVFEIYF